MTPTKVYTDLDEMPTDLQIRTIADEFVDQYMAGQIDYFGIVYKRFYSASSQQAQTLTILPLPELVDDLTTRSQVIWPWDLTFEDFLMSPSADRIVEGLAQNAHPLLHPELFHGCRAERALGADDRHEKRDR